MKKTLIALAALALAGCTTLNNAGYSGITVTRNTVGAFDLAVHDGKEYTARVIMFNAQTGALVVEEGASKAFKGQGVAAKAATLLPLNDIVDILGK